MKETFERKNGNPSIHTYFYKQIALFVLTTPVGAEDVKERWAAAASTCSTNP